MTTVLRHDIDDEGWAREHAAHAWSSVETFLEYVGRKPDALVVVWDWALLSFQYRTVVDPTASEAATWQALRLAAQAGSGIFAAAQVTDGEVSYDVGGRVRLPATGPTSNANAGQWLSVTWLAVILRDEEMVARLCTVPLDTLRASGAEHDAHMYPWVETLQTFLRRDPVPASVFRATMAGTDPDTAQVAPPRVMLQLIYPPIQMFYYLLRRDEQRFNEALKQALIQHRNYWTGADRADDVDGFVALAPLAIAVLAITVGMTVEVESDYLPAHLLHGTEPHIE